MSSTSERNTLTDIKTVKSGAHLRRERMSIVSLTERNTKK